MTTIRRGALACGHREHVGDRLIKDQRDAYFISVDAMRADNNKRAFRIDVAVLKSPDLPSTCCFECMQRVEQMLRPKAKQRGMFE